TDPTLGVINWLPPFLGLTMSMLSPLFALLKGDTALSSPWQVTPEAKKALEAVAEAIGTRKLSRVEPGVSFTLCNVIASFHLMGIIVQWNESWQDPLHVL
ncbi:POK19 protein, partial [Crypturellus undulatus]|nr:POK19 protein [Crypturellus undulatus]